MDACDDTRVLQSAAIAAGAMIGLSREQVMAIVCDQHGSLMVTRNEPIPSTHRCALFVRICSALKGVLGRSQENIEHWLLTENLSLQGIPQAIMAKDTGLQKVLDYLEAQANHA